MIKQSTVKKSLNSYKNISTAFSLTYAMADYENKTFAKII